jgi:hypothetical protein
MYHRHKLSDLIYCNNYVNNNGGNYSLVITFAGFTDLKQGYNAVRSGITAGST